jgi:hypothetical protein
LTDPSSLRCPAANYNRMASDAMESQCSVVILAAS